MSTEKKTILCIDDDKDFLFSLRVILEKNGYTVEEAASAEEGLKRFKAVSPALVIVDMMMEEIDSGRNFVKEVRNDNKGIPIFLFSSVGDQLSQTTNYMELGFNGVLQKPVDPKALLATIKSKLG